MFNLNSSISIGKFTGVKPVAVAINKSIYSYADKAVIKLPITARVRQNGEVITESAETSKLITEGMLVTIALGYNGTLVNEFTGFVSRVNLASPCEVICEGYSYQLRKKTYLRTFVNTELKAVLTYLIAGTDIVLASNIPGFKIDKLVLQNHSGTEVLEMIKKVSDNNINIFFTGSTLNAGLKFTTTKNTVKYQLGFNVIKDGALKLRQAKNEDVVIKYVGEKKDGTTLTASTKSKNATAGNTGETKIIKSHAVTDTAALQQMADSKLQQLSYDGYEGKITTFLVPYAEPGDKAAISDLKYSERSGNYLIDSTETSYSVSGARRVVGIAFKL